MVIAESLAFAFGQDDFRKRSNFGGSVETSLEPAPALPEIDLSAIRSRLEPFDFAKPHSSLAALHFAVHNLRGF